MTEQNITKIINVEMQRSQNPQIEDKVIEMNQVPTPTFDAHVEFEPSLQIEANENIQAPTQPTFAAQTEREPSLQMEGATGPGTAGAVADVLVTAGEDEERTEKEEGADWITNEVELDAYFNNFWANGYGSLDFIRQIADKDDLVEIDITDPDHQMHLMHHIQKLNSM